MISELSGTLNSLCELQLPWPKWNLIFESLDPPLGTWAIYIDRHSSSDRIAVLLTAVSLLRVPVLLQPINTIVCFSLLLSTFTSQACVICLPCREENPRCPIDEDSESHLMVPEDAVEEGSQVVTISLTPVPIALLVLQKFFPDKFAQRDINKLKVKCQFTKCDDVMLVKYLKVISQVVLQTGFYGLKEIMFFTIIWILCSCILDFLLFYRITVLRVCLVDCAKTVNS